MAAKRNKAAPRRPKRKREVSEEVVVKRSTGRTYRVLDGSADDLAPDVWAAIERFEDAQLGVATQTQAFEEFCPESDDDGGGAWAAPAAPHKKPPSVAADELQDGTPQSAIADPTTDTYCTSCPHTSNIAIAITIPPTPPARSLWCYSFEPKFYAVSSLHANEPSKRTESVEPMRPDAIVVDQEDESTDAVAVPPISSPLHEPSMTEVEANPILNPPLPLSGEDNAATMADESLAVVPADALHVVASLSVQCPSLASWLSTDVVDAPVPSLDDVFTEGPPPEAIPRVELAPLLQAMPPALRARCHLVPADGGPAAPRVVYWVRHAWRVHHNYGLAVVQQLARQLQLPVVAFCELSRALVGPQTSTSDPSHPSSVADLRRQLQAHAIPLYAVLASANDAPETRHDRVVEALNSFRPQAIVTDDSVAGCHATQRLVLARLQASVLLVDNACVVPWRRLQGDAVLAKERFKALWSASVDEFLRAVPPLDFDLDHQSREFPPPPAHGFSVHTVAWELLDRPADVAQDVSESVALNHGRGVLSCLPYLCHGSLAPVHLLLTLLSLQSKVLYMRAIEYCVLAREYDAHVQSHLEQTEDVDALRMYQAYLPTAFPLPAFPAQSAYLPYALEASATTDGFWNDIQTHLRTTGYLHPVLGGYWARRLLEWSPSLIAGLAIIEALLLRYGVGTTTSDVLGLLRVMIAGCDVPANEPAEKLLRQQLANALRHPPVNSTA
ncbi:hypothetical protein ACHHYP_13270 [Achlya hypogyna]|uniref:Photolyase/cryptochrome alpha/beta domain-containing protein n=1 Tax=Achlya hypogyna TaxID=1202772 RepID=A0A1V9YFP8_ACHHY|nr:hypothetical protein ACHHYP_13270 [Achlya hypogyna]